MQEQEVWRDIKGYEGYYQASNLGRVKRLPRKYKVKYRQSFRVRSIKERIVKPHIKKNGYCEVTLSKDGIHKFFLVHRLVLSTFVREAIGSEECDHIDGNPHNNNVENLRWVSHIENMNNPVTQSRRAWLKGRIFSHETRKKISDALSKSKTKKRTPVIKCDLQGNEIARYKSMFEASKMNDIADVNIAKSIKENRPSKGWIWKHL